MDGDVVFLFLSLLSFRAHIAPFPSVGQTNLTTAGLPCSFGGRKNWEDMRVSYSCPPPREITKHGFFGGETSLRPTAAKKGTKDMEGEGIWRMLSVPPSRRPRPLEGRGKREREGRKREKPGKIISGNESLSLLLRNGRRAKLRSYSSP